MTEDLSFSGISAACCIYTYQVSSRMCMKCNVPLEVRTVFAAEKKDDDSGIGALLRTIEKHF